MMARSSLLYHPALPIASLVGAVAVVAIVSPSAQAATARLTQWQFNSGTNQLEITLDQSITPRYFLVAQPARIVLDLPNTKLGSVDTQQTYSGAVRRIRVSQFQKDKARIVVELAPDVVLKEEQVKLQKVGKRWVLRPLIATATRRSVPVTVQPPLQPSPAVRTPPPAPITPPLSPSAVTSPTVPSSPSSTANLSVSSSSLPPASTPRSQPTPTVSVPLPTPRQSTPPLAIPSMGAPSAIPTAKEPPTAVPLPPPPTTLDFPRPTTPLRFPTNSSPTAIQSSTPGSTANRPPTVIVPPPGQPPRSTQPPTTLLPAIPRTTTTSPARTVPRPSPSLPTPAVPNPVRTVQTASQPKPSTTSRPRVLIPVIQFGQPLPRVFAPSAKPTLPPPEPGAIVLPVEGPR